MKKLIISAIVMATLLIACQSNNSEMTKQTAASEAEHEHSDALQEHEVGPSMATITDGGKTSAINEIVIGYLKLKNALTQDNAKGAANAGKEIIVAIAHVDVQSFTAEQKKTFDEIIDDATEQAEHIGDNAGKIEHQREHFAMLSQDVSDLIETFGAGQTLYQDFCPMYDDGKGAIWISETKEIKNPYMGSKMLSCGRLKNEL